MGPKFIQKCKGPKVDKTILKKIEVGRHRLPNVKTYDKPTLIIRQCGTGIRIDIY